MSDRPERWTLTEAGEDVSGPIRLLDWDTPTEVNMVRKTWWRSMRQKPPLSKFPLMSDMLGHEDYWQGGVEARDRLMGSSEIRLATSPGGHTILGWACLRPEQSTVLYVFVQELYRRRGLAKQMLADVLEREMFYPLRTYDGAAANVPPRWRYSAWRLIA